MYLGQQDTTKENREDVLRQQAGEFRGFVQQ
jgi:hypothetical protein